MLRDSIFRVLDAIKWNLGRFPFVRTDRPADHSNHNENLTFTQNQAAEHTRRRWRSNKNSWKKAFFIVKMAGRAMIRPASSDFLKEPSDSGLQS